MRVIRYWFDMNMTIHDPWKISGLFSKQKTWQERASIGSDTGFVTDRSVPLMVRWSLSESDPSGCFTVEKNWKIQACPLRDLFLSCVARISCSKTWYTCHDFWNTSILLLFNVRFWVSILQRMPIASKYVKHETVATTCYLKLPKPAKFPSTFQDSYMQTFTIP